MFSASVQKTFTATVDHRTFTAPGINPEYIVHWKDIMIHVEDIMVHWVMFRFSEGCHEHTAGGYHE